jgi:hypothetical protein
MIFGDIYFCSEIQRSVCDNFLRDNFGGWIFGESLA